MAYKLLKKHPAANKNGLRAPTSILISPGKTKGEALKAAHPYRGLETSEALLTVAVIVVVVAVTIVVGGPVLP